MLRFGARRTIPRCCEGNCHCAGSAGNRCGLAPQPSPLVSLYPLRNGAPARRLILILTAGACALAPAQTPPLRLDPLFVAGRSTDLVGTAASASQGIVGAAELADRPFLRRGELLEVIPGVVTTQHSGDGKANQYFLRGFNLDHGTDFAIGVDGMPANLRSHAHGQGYADLNFLIPELVRQVDYTKGPFFADVGDFSSAGAAEFRLTDALPQPFASFTVGEHRFVRFATGATRRAGAAATTAAVEFSHDDGPWQVSEDSGRYNAFVRRVWSAGNNDYRLTLMGYHGRWRSTDQIPQRAVDAGLVDRLGSLDPTDGGTSHRLSLSFDANLKGAGGTTRMSAYAVHHRLNLYSNFTYYLNDPVNGDQFNQVDERAVLGGGVTHTWSGPRSSLVAGLQLRDDEIGALGLFQTSRRTRLGVVREDVVREASAGLFARAETRWTEKVRTNAGARLDGYSFRVASDRAENSGTRLAGIASPKAGLVLGPWSRTEVYLNAGTGFHSNDARGTTVRVDPADGFSPVDRVDPLVRSRGVEVGVRTAAVPGLLSSLAVWGLDLDSELVFVGDAGGTEPKARTRRGGVEWANFYRAAPWLVLDGDLALTHARYRGDPTLSHVANSIGTVVTAGASLSSPRGGFASLRARYFGPQPLTEDGSVRSPSTLTCNLRVGWRAPGWEFAVEVLNALDRRDADIAYHYVSRLRGEAAEGRGDVHFHPAEPRTLRLGLTRRF